MSLHLSPQEVSEWLLDEHAPEVERHLRNCRPCLAELIYMRQALSQFRNSARYWGEEQLDREVEIELTPGTPVWNSLRRACLAVAVLMCSIFASLSIRQAPADAPVADVALLRQVGKEVSRTVPRPMEPLLKLMSASDAAVE